MKTIRVFIASSGEMRHERLQLIDMILDLNNEMEESGHCVEIEPVIWEFMDSAMRDVFKEEEYLAELRQCEICITMFKRACGQYTVQEMDVSLAEQEKGNRPHIIQIYFEGGNNANVSPALFSLRSRIVEEHPDICAFPSDASELRKAAERLLYEYCIKEDE